MGINMRELLSLDYFQEFKVLAGFKGLNHDIQGVTVMDAPDCYKWNKGKELVISNGFVFQNDKECYNNLLRVEPERRIAGFMLKEGRYLDPIPKEMISSFDEQHIPLILMPFALPYMEVINQVNVAVMNKNMKRFLIHDNPVYNGLELTYKERKIESILQSVEKEMRFPALLYDMLEEKSYYSSSSFIRKSDKYKLNISDFWEPVMKCSKHTLCDNLNMVRIRMLEDPVGEEDYKSSTRFSWITIPITVDKKIQAYFVVMESRELMDYFDEYSIRIAIILLQSVYEQIVIARTAGNIGFENLIHFALSYGDNNPQQLMIQANSLNLNLKTQYFFVVLHQTNTKLSLTDYRGEVTQCSQKSFPPGSCNFAFTGLNECLFLFQDEKIDTVKASPEIYIRKILDRFHSNLSEKIKGGKLLYGLFHEKATLIQASRVADRCRRAIKLGVLLYPSESVFQYYQLGPLAWLQVPEDEVEMMFRQYLPVLQDKKNEELLKTLKIYLENNMNYSATAEKMYVHINTIRKRIDRMEELLLIDWKDHMTKIKLELMLRLFHY